MSTWKERIALATALETQIIERLNATGWQAFQFGQGQLPQECRDRLIRFEDGARRPSLLRWLPDIITFCERANGSVFVALIDAKTCLSDTPNYSIESSSIETAEVITDKLYTPVFFVFGDFMVLTPRETRQRGRQGPPPKRGSGTPYMLIEKRFARPFEAIFPVRSMAA